ncbi:cytochrome c oxidase subunit IV [Mesonia hippocampi]|uniref:Cytochrome c oxidase subunit IV n=1 Tax=Mesonia hippocampi TaxID=1628250 RepID=A0A840EV83_9FLAO|nr:cytochrome C oxidase subunit IV family protein [Mesonia hippocampi]MBB4118777.1 cytochrome c oxidase subunit IV [Mesonia hippocampi]
MAQDASHSTNAVKRIWTVFVILSVITLVEVVLGIFRPEVLINTSFLTMHLLNWIFIILTIAKAYYIVWSFMHMEHETKGLRRSVVWTVVFLVCYLTFILLDEGTYIFNVYKDGYIQWKF